MSEEFFPHLFAPQAFLYYQGPYLAKVLPVNMERDHARGPAFFVQDEKIPYLRENIAHGPYYEFAFSRVFFQQGLYPVRVLNMCFPDSHFVCALLLGVLWI